MNIGVWISLAVLCMIRVSECLECYSCQNIADPDECRNTSQCSSGQSCSLHTFQAGSDLRYNMGCENNQLCSSSAVGANSIIGRSVQTRQQQHTCHECCSADRCNQNLCAHRNPSECIDDGKLDCALLNSLFNVCADVHHAKITCPKFCGLCQLVDGNWSAWEDWSSCSVTCEDGKQTRTRTCTNPPPSNGGLNCTGSAIDFKLCTKQLCPVHGNWTDWSAWSGCSVTCDVGMRKRTRTCTNPKPDRSGDYCVGESSEYTVCLTDPCGTRNGGWSSWGLWQSCSVTCGVGLKLRSRTCTNPSPSAYGKSCEGNTETFSTCVNTPCYVVAFNARGFNELSNRVNAFDFVVFNEGNAYNTSSGFFTAPVDGVYYFTAQICSYIGKTLAFIIGHGINDWNFTYLMTKPTFVPHHGNVSCSNTSGTVNLKRNDNVFVRMDYRYNSSDIYVGLAGRNEFTGTLVQEL